MLLMTIFDLTTMMTTIATMSVTYGMPRMLTLKMIHTMLMFVVFLFGQGVRLCLRFVLVRTQDADGDAGNAERDAMWQAIDGHRRRCRRTPHDQKRNRQPNRSPCTGATPYYCTELYGLSSGGHLGALRSRLRLARPLTLRMGGGGGKDAGGSAARQSSAGRMRRNMLWWALGWEQKGRGKVDPQVPALASGIGSCKLLGSLRAGCSDCFTPRGALVLVASQRWLWACAKGM